MFAITILPTNLLVSFLRPFSLPNPCDTFPMNKYLFRTKKKGFNNTMRICRAAAIAGGDKFVVKRVH